VDIAEYKLLEGASTRSVKWFLMGMQNCAVDPLSAGHIGAGVTMLRHIGLKIAEMQTGAVLEKNSGIQGGLESMDQQDVAQVAQLPYQYVGVRQEAGRCTYMLPL